MVATYINFDIGDLSRFWLFCLGAFGFIASKTLNYLAFQSFDFNVHVYNIYVFITKHYIVNDRS